jgi:hypothetical protein
MAGFYHETGKGQQMTINLFRCEPLNASITPKQCKANQQRGVFACEKCKGNLGLPVQLTEIKREEIKDMARPKINATATHKKGDRFICPGCNKERAYSSRNLCEVCAKADRKKQLVFTEQPKNSQTVQKMPLSAVMPEPEPNTTCPKCGEPYHAQGCNECPKCGHEWNEGWEEDDRTAEESEPVEVPQDFGKVTNVAGEKAGFGVDPLVLANVRRTLAELEQRILIDLSNVGYFESLDYLQDIRHGMARAVLV